MTTGIAPTFNAQDFIKVAQQLVDADEVERALWLLNNVPAYFRQHLHPEILDFKRSILSRMITPAGYQNDQHDCAIMDEMQARSVVKGTLRGVLLEHELTGKEKYHVVDVGPGEYWVPKGIGGSYSYLPVGLDSNTREAALKDPVVEEKVFANMLLGINVAGTIVEPIPVGVFVALEVIEHLPEPMDLAVECAKYFQDEPHYIHLSTPLFTFDASDKSKAKYLPHLRAYTPNEFLIEAHRLWPHYEWQIYLSGPVMSLRGLHPEAKRRERLI